MDRDGDLRTWSTPTGKLLYYERSDESLSEWLEEFEVYMCEQNDIAYTSNNHDEANEALQLLRSRQKVEDILKRSEVSSSKMS